MLTRHIVFGMNYAPLWDKIVTSSLWAESDLVVKVFITMLARKGPDHVVRGTAYDISIFARKTEKEVLSALRVLSSPDRKRLEEQDFDGRRIQKVHGGWLVLNGQKYRDLIGKEWRRNYQRQWQAAKRAMAKMSPSEKLEYQRIEREEYNKRKKDLKRDAACDGAQTAINEGLAP